MAISLLPPVACEREHLLQIQSYILEKVDCTCFCFPIWFIHYNSNQTRPIPWLLMLYWLWYTTGRIQYWRWVQSNGIATSNGQKCQSLGLNFRYFCIFCVDPMHRFMTEIMIQKVNVTATPTGTPPSPSGSLRVMCGCISPQTDPKTPMGSEAFTPQQPCQTRVRYCTIQNKQGFVRHCFVGDILKFLVNPWLFNLCCWGCIF